MCIPRYCTCTTCGTTGTLVVHTYTCVLCVRYTWMCSTRYTYTQLTPNYASNKDDLNVPDAKSTGLLPCLFTTSSLAPAFNSNVAAFCIPS